MQIDSFAYYISVLRKQFTAYCTEKLSEVGVTYGQLYIIIYVGKMKECSPKDISLSLKLDAGHLNRALSKLIENELIEQRKNVNDRRSNIVILTEKGKQVFEMSHNLFQEWDNMILSQLDDSNRQNMMDCIKKITFYNNNEMEN